MNRSMSILLMNRSMSILLMFQIREREKSMKIRRIVSGGQTGADRAALDVALELGIDCGGWCPRGRKAEDGVIPERYPLRQTLSPGYRQRTELNVADSDGTLICYVGELMGGSQYTREMAIVRNKPRLFIDLAGMDAVAAAEEVSAWIHEHGIETLNVAGPRVSHCPKIYDLTCELMRNLLM